MTMPGDSDDPGASAARQAFAAKLAALSAFEAAPPNGWNFLGSPSWQQWLRLKEEAAMAEAAYQAWLTIELRTENA